MRFWGAVITLLNQRIIFFRAAHHSDARASFFPHRLSVPSATHQLHYVNTTLLRGLNLASRQGLVRRPLLPTGSACPLYGRAGGTIHAVQSWIITLTLSALVDWRLRHTIRCHGGKQDRSLPEYRPNRSSFENAQPSDHGARFGRP